MSSNCCKLPPPEGWEVNHEKLLLEQKTKPCPLWDFTLWKLVLLWPFYLKSMSGSKISVEKASLWAIRAHLYNAFIKQFSFICRWLATAIIGPSYDFLNFNKNVETNIIIKVEDVSDLVWAFSHSLLIWILGFTSLCRSQLAVHWTYKLRYWFELWKIKDQLKDQLQH